MKVFIFSTAYLPLIGGAEIAVKEITDRLDDDYQFEMITAKLKKGLPDFERIGNVNVHRVGYGCFLDKYLLPILGYFKAKKIIEKCSKTLFAALKGESAKARMNADNQRKSADKMIWSIMASYGGLAALFFKLRNPKIPFLLTLQEGDSKSRIFWRSLPIYPFFKMIFKKADYVQAISNYLANFAREQRYKGRVEVVPNGVDIKAISHQLSTPKDGQAAISVELRDKLNIKENEKVILTVSRLVKKNGIEDLIKAAKYFRFPFKMIIIGVGPLGRKLKSRCFREAKNRDPDLTESTSGLNANIIFLGNIDYSQLPQYYALADVFVRPSLSEGLGNVFLEAMANGVPVIGTPVGGIPDFLKDKETGLFCEVKNPKSIAGKIELLLKDEDLRKRLTENGRKLVEEKYDWDLIARKMEKVLTKVLSLL